MLQVPQEIVEGIVDIFAAPIDLASLKQCCLVARTWTARCQFHIFHRIYLVYKNGSRGMNLDCQRLHHCLTTSPHLALYIREMIVREGNVAKLAAWVTTEPTLPLVLRKLSNLRMLHLWRLDWSECSNDVRSSLHEAIPGLLELHLDWIEFPKFADLCGLLSYAKELKALTLREVSCHDVFAFRPEHWMSFQLGHVDRERPPVLDFLHLEIGWANLFVSVLNPQRGALLLDITRLRTLLCINLLDDTVIKTLLPILGVNGRLERLQLGSILRTADGQYIFSFSAE